MYLSVYAYTNAQLVIFNVRCTAYAAQASEVMEKSGRPYATLVGWAVLMSQGQQVRARQRERDLHAEEVTSFQLCSGENMAFTYPLIAEVSGSIWHHATVADPSDWCRLPSRMV